jgi:uncharacterized damage-inducible protein DinB
MNHTEKQQQDSGRGQQEPKALLIAGCLNCIEQCDQILTIISQENYIHVSNGSSSIGAHIRHIFDRFHCFFAGLAASSIEYDERKRDKEIEQNLEAAGFALASLTRRIEQLREPSYETPQISVRETVLSSSSAVEIPSTIERELMALITHSIHHLAIIALIARSFGHQLDSDFGKAPSTIVYERG